MKKYVKENEYKVFYVEYDACDDAYVEEVASFDEFVDMIGLHLDDAELDYSLLCDYGIVRIWKIDGYEYDLEWNSRCRCLYRLFECSEGFMDGTGFRAPTTEESAKAYEKFFTNHRNVM